MRSKRKENIQNIIVDFYNCQTDQEAFPNSDFYGEYNLNADFIKQSLENKYYVLKAPIPREKQKYYFVNSKPFYQRNFAYYDQINYLEQSVKESHFPRNELTEAIDEDRLSTKLSQIKSNAIVNKFLPNNRVLMIAPNFPYNISIVDYSYQPGNQSQLESVKPKLEEISEEKVIYSESHLHVNDYQISNKLAKSKILQLSNAPDNQFHIRTQNACYQAKLADSIINQEEEDNEIQPEMNGEEIQEIQYEKKTKECIQILQQTIFREEVFNVLQCPYIKEDVYYLTDENIIYKYSDGQKQKYTISTEQLNQKVPRYNPKHPSELLEHTHHPKTLLFSNMRSVCQFDQRSQDINLLINGHKSDELCIIYAIKHLQGQYFMTSGEQFISLYDIRYPSEPFLRFSHYSDENPPNIIGTSEIYDPINSNTVNNVDDLTNLLSNLDVTDENQEQNRLIYSFSTMNNGTSLLFPNKIFKKFDIINDKYNDINERDDVYLGLTNLKLMNDGPSYMSFEDYSHPKMLFSTSILNNQYRCRGMSVVHFGTDIVAMSVDNMNNVTVSNLKDMGNKIHLLSLRGKEEEEEQKGSDGYGYFDQEDAKSNGDQQEDHTKGKIGEFSEFFEGVNSKFYEKFNFGVLKNQIHIEESKKVRFNEDQFEYTADDIEGVDPNLKDYNSDEFEEYEEPAIYESFNLKKLAEVLVTSDERYILAEKYLKRQQKKEPQRIADLKQPKHNIQQIIEEKEPNNQDQEEQYDEDGFAMPMSQQQTQPNNNNRQSGISREQVQKKTKTFQVNQSLIDYLSDNW